jgi:hypothetical protein
MTGGSQKNNLNPRVSSGAKITHQPPCGWRLEIPAGDSQKYRLAQLDDYSLLPRHKFPWKPPLSLTFNARASSNDIPGTWGFGFWNDPFGISSGVKGGNRKFPALPNTAWFFMASPPNHLTIHDALPGQGNLVGVIKSPSFSGITLLPSFLLLPFVFVSPISRIIRKVASHLIMQDAKRFTINHETWHKYQIIWDIARVEFIIDDKPALRTCVTLTGPLGIVIWIDNQYASWTPDGRISMGTLQNSNPAWIEVQEIHCE